MPHVEDALGGMFCSATNLPIARLLRSQVSKRGWRGKRLRDATRELREENQRLINAAVTEYASTAKPSARSVYREYIGAATAAGCRPVAFSTFQDYLADQPQSEVIEAREGMRAALSAAPTLSYLS
ncbi:MAG: hypothetical protein H0U19_03920, partial [Acidobacteria bacterium]|nr:hypothetical protein [Acidobacteriota bacterium]